MEKVKKSVGFTFSCGQCHCRMRQDLIKDQKNNTVIEKRPLRHTNSHTPVSNVYLKTYNGVLYQNFKGSATQKAGCRGGQRYVLAAGKNLCPWRARICARGGQRSVPAAGSDLCPWRAAICAHGGQRPVPVAVRLSNCII
jgi:hypothetical protein